MADPVKINGEQSWLDAPTFDPSADFQVAGSGQPNDPNVGGVPNDALRAGSVAGVPDAPQVSGGQAVGLALARGATADFADELYGAEQAAPDLPYWLRPFVLPYKA